MLTVLVVFALICHQYLFFHQFPGKKGTGSAGWIIQARLNVFMWLGINKHRKDMLKGLPGGYKMTREMKNASKPSQLPPPSVRYEGKVCV